MAVFSAAVSFLLLIFLSTVNGNTAPAVDCSAVFLNMANCLPFVIVGSQVDKPEDSCCTGLKKVLDTNVVCLCEGLKKSGSMGVNVNVTKASTLPTLCKLTAPPMSSCPLSTTTPPASTPAPVPAAGPKPGLGSGPTTAPAPAPGPSQMNHGSSLIPSSPLSFMISGALVLLFSRI